MMRRLPNRLRAFLLSLLLLGGAQWAAAQTLISGRVTDGVAKPVRGASVSLDNTLDGATTDSTGAFSFTTTETGAQTLVTVVAGIEPVSQGINLDGQPKTGLRIQLATAGRTLAAVTVSAGAYEASNDKNKAILSTLDIVTTAGANADVVRAIQTLPGTQQQGTQTGLFVRGGDASEASVVVDGLTVQNAFFSSAPGVAARSRFGPWQFKGVSFSSGGYSARYGQALSSILELNSLDLIEKTTVNLGLNMAGVYASGAKLWKNSSGNIGFNYTNLTPFYGLAKTNVDFYDVPKGFGGSASYNWKPNKNGIVKLLLNGQRFSSGTRVPNPAVPGGSLDFGLKNSTVYGTLSYRQQLRSRWTLYTATSYSYNQDDISWSGAGSVGKDRRAQGRAELKRSVSSSLSILAGGELQHFSFERRFDTLVSSFTENIAAGYAEAEWSPAKWIALRPGLRYEHSALLGQSSLAPRLSLALRAGVNGQFSVAGGAFYQSADYQYLLYGYRPQLQLALHYIANYQYIDDNRTFRIEGYYKDYQHLVRERASFYDPNSYRYIYTQVDNSGYGYARGAELFWRDRKLVKNLDYWVSYSYIDTRRLYKNYIAEATPDFISDHNLSLVGKYWINKITTQINMTYSYASGRPYYNPNFAGDAAHFLQDRTPDYHNLSFTVNYLTHIKKWFTVVYAGVDNVTNHKNIFGYRYSLNGQQRFPQYPALFRSFFVGANFSLTEFNKDEL